MEIRLLGDVDAIEWQAIRAVLNSNSAHHLKRFDVRLLVWPTALRPSPNMESYVRSYLPELSAQGVLHFIR